jgi:ABC-type spermidine/putrescine transport system permease subunit I
MGVSLRLVPGKATHKSASVIAVFADCSVLDQFADSHLWPENIPQHQRVSEYILLWLGVIDEPIRVMFTPAAVIIGLVYILLPFMVMPLYSSIEKLDKPCWKRRRFGRQ